MTFEFRAPFRARFQPDRLGRKNAEFLYRARRSVFALCSRISGHRDCFPGIQHEKLARVGRLWLQNNIRTTAKITPPARPKDKPTLTQNDSRTNPEPPQNDSRTTPEQPQKDSRTTQENPRTTPERPQNDPRRPQTTTEQFQNDPSTTACDCLRLPATACDCLRLSATAHDCMQAPESLRAPCDCRGSPCVARGCRKSCGFLVPEMGTENHMHF